LERKIQYKSVSGHSLDDLKLHHSEATKFFASQLMLLKEAIPNISDERQGKVATLLISCTQTGAALLQLAHQPTALQPNQLCFHERLWKKLQILFMHAYVTKKNIALLFYTPFVSNII
jgi:hypothetical protein